MAAGSHSLVGRGRRRTELPLGNWGSCAVYFEPAPHVRDRGVDGVLVSIVVRASPAEAHAASIYVAVTGSDAAGDGSLGSPYATVQKAVNMAASGDVVSVGTRRAAA